MTYPTANITGIVDLFQYTNTVTNDVFTILLLLTLYLVPLIYLLLKGEEWLNAGMASGFVLVIATILLRVAQITTSDRYIFLSIAALIIPLVISWLTKTS